jgi:hypothetical protein
MVTDPACDVTETPAPVCHEIVLGALSSPVDGQSQWAGFAVDAILALRGITSILVMNLGTACSYHCRRSAIR